MQSYVAGGPQGALPCEQDGEGLGVILPRQRHTTEHASALSMLSRWAGRRQDNKNEITGLQSTSSFLSYPPRAHSYPSYPEPHQGLQSRRVCKGQQFLYSLSWARCDAGALVPSTNQADQSLHPSSLPQCLPPGYWLLTVERSSPLLIFLLFSLLLIFSFLFFWHCSLLCREWKWMSNPLHILRNWILAFWPALLPCWECQECQSVCGSGACGGGLLSIPAVQSLVKRRLGSSSRC